MALEDDENKKDDDGVESQVAVLTRKDVLQAERNRCVKFITEKEIDLRVLETTDPKLVVGRKAGAIGPDGQPMSYVSVSAKDMIVSTKKDREGKIARLAAIDALMAEEGDVKGI